MTKRGIDAMYQRYVKRILDFILSLAATIVLAIPMGIIALWIKADSRVLFFSSSAASAKARPTLTF